MNTEALNLDAIRARAEAASPGPWRSGDQNEGMGVPPFWCVDNDAYTNPTEENEGSAFSVLMECGSKEDAEFIAAARTDVPALLDALEERAERSPSYDELLADHLRLMQQADEWRAVVKEMGAENERLTALTSVCSCYDGNPANYEGAHADCPIHGAIQAFNDATRELAEARAENAALDEAMHTVWLDSGKWRLTTSKMTTEAREAAVAAVLRFDRTMKSADPDDEFLSRDSLAWWDDRRAVGQPEEVTA